MTRWQFGLMAGPRWRLPALERDAEGILRFAELRLLGRCELAKGQLV
jgi:hypothetical protein